MGSSTQVYLSDQVRPSQVTTSKKPGVWHIPTPTSADVYTGNMELSQQSDDSMHSVSLPDFVNRFPTPSTMDHIDRKHMRPSRAATNRKTGYLSEMIGNWPTPDAGIRGSRSEGAMSADKQSVISKNGQRMRGTDLSTAARMFPTPRTGKTTDEDEESWLARHAAGKVATPLLALAARMFPTPGADEGGGAYQNNRGGGPHGIRGGSWAKERLVETFGEEDAVAMSGGSLSPDWVSWLMGLPVGWTSLEPLPREEYLDWFHAQQDGTWWQEERGLPRIATGIPDRVNRLKCLGNGIVPASLALFLRGTR